MPLGDGGLTIAPLPCAGNTAIAIFPAFRGGRVRNALRAEAPSSCLLLSLNFIHFSSRLFCLYALRGKKPWRRPSSGSARWNEGLDNKMSFGGENAEWLPTCCPSIKRSGLSWKLEILNLFLWTKRSFGMVWQHLGVQRLPGLVPEA